MSAASSQGMSQQELNNKRAAHLTKFRWQPGQSGNPAGRKPGEKFLLPILLDYLRRVPPEEFKKIEKWRRKHKKGSAPPELYDRGQLLVMELFNRAMGGSDYLMAHLLERVDGKLAPDTEKEREENRRYDVLVVDMPRPYRPHDPQLPAVATKPIDVKPTKPSGNGSK